MRAMVNIPRFERVRIDLNEWLIPPVGQYHCGGVSVHFALNSPLLQNSVLFYCYQSDTKHSSLVNRTLVCELNGKRSKANLDDWIITFQ